MPTYPEPQTRPVDAAKLLPSKHQGKRFLSWRNRGGANYDNIRPYGALPSAVCSKGVELEGRELVCEPWVVQAFASFPPAFCLAGAHKLKQLGNSVPPLFMRAIAKHVKETILNA